MTAPLPVARVQRGPDPMTTDRNSVGAELLPCPFCGGPAVIVKNSFPPRNPWRHPSCENYDCPAHVEEQDEQGGTNVDCQTDAEAAAKWNTRASPSATEVQALVEEWRNRGSIEQSKTFADELAKLIPRGK